MKVKIHDRGKSDTMCDIVIDYGGAMQNIGVLPKRQKAMRGYLFDAKTIIDLVTETTDTSDIETDAKYKMGMNALGVQFLITSLRILTQGYDYFGNEGKKKSINIDVVFNDIQSQLGETNED